MPNKVKKNNNIPFLKIALFPMEKKRPSLRLAGIIVTLVEV